jgi:EF hand
MNHPVARAFSHRVSTKPRSALQILSFSVLLVAGGIYASHAFAQAATDPGQSKPAAGVEKPQGQQGWGHRGRGDPMAKHMDTDKDGSVSKAELLAAQQKQLEMFDRADTNKDGKLSAEERKAFHETMRAEHRAKKG